jgi:hypothetical protein
VNLANATTAADTIQFAASAQGRTLVLTGGELVLTSDVTIYGGGVTIDGNDTDPDTGGCRQDGPPEPQGGALGAEGPGCDDTGEGRIMRWRAALPPGAILTCGFPQHCGM